MTRSPQPLRIAVLDSQLSAQLLERGDHPEGLEVVWIGTDAEAFEREVPELAPEVIAVSLDVLDSDPLAHLERLLGTSGAELALVLYTFARREVLAALEGERSRPLRSPISLERLRGSLSSLIVRKILTGDGEARRQPSGPRVPPRATAPTLPVEDSLSDSPLPAYSLTQLGRLKEIESAVECECPAHVADLLTQLVVFERYSANCANRNDADALIHRMLHRETTRARQIMEGALAQLLEHEKIAL